MSYDVLMPHQLRQVLDFITKTNSKQVQFKYVDKVVKEQERLYLSSFESTKREAIKLKGLSKGKFYAVALRRKAFVKFSEARRIWAKYLELVEIRSEYKSQIVRKPCIVQTR